MWAKFILLGTLLYTGFQAARFLSRYLNAGPSQEPQASEVDRSVREMVRDPICGIYITPDSALTELRRGDRYWFCSEECRLKFLRKEG